MVPNVPFLPYVINGSSKGQPVYNTPKGTISTKSAQMINDIWPAMRNVTPLNEDDVDDDGRTTREAKEEIELVPSLVNVVAILEPFFSKDLGYYQIPIL
ncbi:hypothetical protein Hanom_Chr08g00744701 [Helianthus anomalus]